MAIDLDNSNLLLCSNKYLQQYLRHVYVSETDPCVRDFQRGFLPAVQFNFKDDFDFVVKRKVCPR